MEGIGSGVPSYVWDVMAALAGAGRRGYPVGGCVRDLLRGVTPHDFDMTTDATPEEMPTIFADFRVIPTGLRHGTVTVLSKGHPVEVTTHRTDGTYTDARHPDAVTFTTDIVADLARRDFTVNAMAWHPETGIIDPHGGRADLAAGIIRAVGEPAARFAEDALRILRCFRFAAQLDFEIDPATAAGAAAMAEGLSHVAAERIFAELVRLLIAPAAERGLTAMERAGCLPLVFGGLLPDRARFSALPALPPEAELRLSALLLGHTPEEARALCRTLKTPNAFADKVAAYLAAAGESLPKTPCAARRYVCRHFGGFEGGLCLMAVAPSEREEALALCRRVLRDGTAVELRRLAVNGRELQALGIAPADTGRVLSALQELVWQTPEKNKKPLLLEAAADLWKEKENRYV